VEFHREMGLNMLNEIGLQFLGIRARKEEFIFPSILSFHFVSFNIMYRSYLIIDQHTLLKWIVNRFSPIPFSHLGS
jgi:hypothetical protein